MKRFIIATNRSTTEQDTAFLAILRQKWPHAGWWHHLNEAWLIVDLSGTMTAAALRDAAKQAFPGINLFVTEGKGPGLWAGIGDAKAYEWMANWDQF